MKLDKMKFANLVAFISGRFAVQMDMADIDHLDNLVDIDVPQHIVNPQVIEELMKAIHEGKKLEAIKAYRMIIPTGLKEAKDAVEKDWEFKRFQV